MLIIRKIYHILFLSVILNRRLHILPENNNVTSAVDINNYICRRVWTGIFMIDAHIHISNEIKSETI